MHGAPVVPLDLSIAPADKDLFSTTLAVDEIPGQPRAAEAGSFMDMSPALFGAPREVAPIVSRTSSQSSMANHSFPPSRPLSVHVSPAGKDILHESPLSPIDYLTAPNPSIVSASDAASNPMSQFEFVFFLCAYSLILLVFI